MALFLWNAHAALFVQHQNMYLMVQSRPGGLTKTHLVVGQLTLVLLNSGSIAESKEKQFQGHSSYLATAISAHRKTYTHKKITTNFQSIFVFFCFQSPVYLLSSSPEVKLPLSLAFPRCSLTSCRMPKEDMHGTHYSRVINGEKQREEDICGGVIVYFVVSLFLQLLVQQRQRVASTQHTNVGVILLLKTSLQNHILNDLEGNGVHCMTCVYMHAQKKRRKKRRKKKHCSAS